MLKKLICFFSLIGTLLCFPIFLVEIKAQEAPSKPVLAQISPRKHVIHKRVVYTAPTKLIAEIAIKYEVSQETITKVIACESGYNPNAIGDGGKSFGLVQIHLPSHPTISKEQALNPEFAVDFLGKKLSEGKGNLWTCYRNLNVV